MAKRREPMSRQARTARGAMGAALATVLAAASHSLAGGEVSGFAVVVTAIIALPVCVLLAGRVGSLWRVGLAVGASQFLYHWAFAGIGASASFSLGASFPMGSHAAHLSSLQLFVPDVVEAGSADTLMWALHAVAAGVSTILISRGERAVLALGRSLRRVLPQQLTPAAFERPVAGPVCIEAHVLRDQIARFSAWSLRGPPVAQASPQLQLSF
ncbi:hypothetical protein [Leucobacter aridicollis]|uniref:hypothetical protein n=1 Tax=Leucobacter aridicollis TaxID=283878 RepID=UPI002102FD53|nr:hypothetical protein [Leucobacter aridicollis]UTX52216.1 hypothetical protein KI794_10650 [Leucobacter aridicollis]